MDGIDPDDITTPADLIDENERELPEGIAETAKAIADDWGGHRRGKHPSSVAAASVYAAVKLDNPFNRCMEQQEVSDLFGVSSTTIHKYSSEARQAYVDSD